MTRHPAGPPVGDPFWAEVRRRHPDVDLVLLPPEAPADPTDEPVDDAVVRADLETVRARAAALGLQEPEERVELTATAGAVRAAARAVTHADRDALERLHAAAVAAGWDVRRHPGPVELLLGHGDRLALRASYAPSTGVLVVEVSGPDRVVGGHRAEALTRER